VGRAQAHRAFALDPRSARQLNPNKLPQLSAVHGNKYLRTLFVQAARVVLLKLMSWERYGLKSWIEAAQRRLHHNKLARSRLPTSSPALPGRCSVTVAISK
jgi:hypothetical protein